MILEPAAWILVGGAALVEGDTATAEIPRAAIAGQRLRERLLVLGVHDGHALLVDARRLATEHLDELRIGQLQEGQVMSGSFRGEVGLESVMLADVPAETFGILEPIARKCRRNAIAKFADQNALCRRRSSVDDHIRRVFGGRRDRLRADHRRLIKSAAVSRNRAR